MILIVIINFDLTETTLIKKVVQKRPPKAAQIEDAGINLNREYS